MRSSDEADAPCGSSAFQSTVTLPEKSSAGKKRTSGKVPAVERFDRISRTVAVWPWPRSWPVDGGSTSMRTKVDSSPTS